MNEQKNQNGDGKFWLSRKFWFTVISATVFLVLALTEKVAFTSGEVMIFVLGMAGISHASHVITDVAGLIGSAFGSSDDPGEK